MDARMAIPKLCAFIAYSCEFISSASSSCEPNLLFHECFVRVRSMYENVTHRACLELLTLVVYWAIRRARSVHIPRACIRSHARRVALEAQQVHLIDFEQSWIH